MRELISTISLFILALTVQAQNVGVNTPSPNTTLDVNGALALRANTLALTNADNNNISLTPNSFFRITGPTAAFAITGLAGGADGRLVTLFNTTNFALTIKNANSGSTAANQISTSLGADLVFAAGNSSVTLQYSATESKWIVISNHGPELPKTLNQSAISVFGSSALSVASSASFALVPGLTQTITVPSGAVLYVSSTGGIQTSAATASGFSVCDMAIAVDGALLSNGGFQRLYAANTAGVPSSMISYWNLSSALNLTAGSHTIAIFASGIGSGSTATVSGTVGSVLQGVLTVMVLTK